MLGPIRDTLGVEQVSCACDDYMSKWKGLLHLTKIYFDRFQVKLVGSKSKLLVF